MSFSQRELEIVFGVSSRGTTPEERAATSAQIFVRSQDQIAFMNPQASGLQVNAKTALEHYGMRTLLEAAEYGSAILKCDPSEPAASLIRVRERLELTMESVALASGLPITLIQKAEDRGQCSSIHDLAKICAVLGIDVLDLSVKPHH